MKQTQIISGSFTSKAGSKGNFTGYNAKGERIFANKLQMATIGFNKNEDLKFPFFAVIDTKTIQTRNDAGELTDVTADRLQVCSVFLTADALIQAVNSDLVLEIAAKGALKSAAVAAGLSEAAFESMLTLA